MPFIVAGVFALLISGYLYFRTLPSLSKGRRALLFSLRSIGIYILLLLLLSPVLHFIHNRRELPEILILTDISESMDLRSGSGTKSDFFKPLLSSVEKSFIAAGYKTHRYSFADGLEGSRNNTQLTKTLQDIARQRELSRAEAIVLGSDGWLRDENLNFVNRIGIPFYVIADTTSSRDVDLAVVETLSNRYAYRNEPTLIKARLKSLNYDGNAMVNLYVDNAKVSGISTRMQAGMETEVDFSHRFPRTGFFNYRVEILPLEKEQRLGNNSFPGAIEVLAEKEKILIFTDSPAWDNKFILDAIATNPRWDSVSYLLRNRALFVGEKPATLNQAQTPSVMVIINNGNLAFDVTTLSYIKAMHKQGAGILFQGKPTPDLADIIPIQPSNITSSYQGFLQLNEAGKLHPAFTPLVEQLSKIPPLDYYYVTAKTGGQILGTLNNQQNSPAVVAVDAGGARSLALAFVNLWRWQMQGQQDGYQKFIVNTLTWLSNKALGSFSAIYKSTYLRGEEISLRLRAEDEIRVSALDKTPKIVVYDALGKELVQDYMTRSADEYTFTANLDKPGEYRFEISEADTGKKTGGRFQIAESSAEARDFDYNLPLLSYLASTSRGKLLSQSDVPGFVPMPAVARDTIQKQEFVLYKKWYILSLFILAFCLELFFRRRWGLL